MKEWKRTFFSALVMAVGGLVLLVIAVSLPLMAVAYLVFGPYSNPPNPAILREARSPYGDYTATFYAVGGGGGATGSSAFRVGIQRSGEPLTLNTGAVFEIDHAYDAFLQWSDDQHLTIVYPAGNTAISQQKTQFRDVTITYRQKPYVKGTYHF